MIEDKAKKSPLSGDFDLDNQKCPKCNEYFYFTTHLSTNGADGHSFLYKRFERQNHKCKK